MKSGFVILIVSLFIAIPPTKAQDGPFSFTNKTRIFTGHTQHWIAEQDANYNLHLNSYSDRYFKINGVTFLQNGSVGINTSNPSADLHVNGTFMARNNLTVYSDPGNDQTPFLTSLSLTGRGAAGGIYNWSLYTAAVGGGNGVDPNSFEIWEYPNASVTGNCCRQRFVIAKSHLETASPKSVIIDGAGGLALGGYTSAGLNTLSVNGNVGIGTDNSYGYKLAVAGNMIAEKIKVKLQSAWPDYVFEETYQLMKLEDMEKFIRQNKHLPGIPSASEVKKNDIDLAELNIALLKKVEELTLHLISMEKELKAVKESVKK